ncbi:MAG: exodeoxyribonuclease VII large subunit [Lysobacterales bacterium CG17_big_fil_post_rev_8_21_14_2_50_64_11]|nr:MAG: exodeoxyribonuclease VII large subunit [Xanthomonadales bacterium CG17_big_fil_post_rev_8_21_14_2_50_64_11]
MATDRSRILSPTQLNVLARDLLEGSFAGVWVQGEISNLARPGSGHIYLTLKDGRAQVRCAMFRAKAQRLAFAPSDGMQVLVCGKVTVYEARGDYQLVIEIMEEAGEGVLRQQFERLKAKLASEGLFASERKQPLPALLRRLAVITSPSGAAVRDVLSVIRRRFALLPVDILPVPVQGKDAAPQIQQMLQRADASGRYDALLLTRGGGSLEDLWCFNDEALARTIAALRTPLVSAIGHEIDFTLADFAADLRAATPSAAAELLVPDRDALLARVQRAGERCAVAIRRQTLAAAQSCDRSFMALRHASPAQRLARGRQQLAVGARALQRLRQQIIGRPSERMATLHHRLQRLHPAAAIDSHRLTLNALATRLQRSMSARIVHARQHSDGAARALLALNPLAITRRGYALLRRADDGQVIRSWQQVASGERLRAELAEGRLLLQVIAANDGQNPTE